MTQQKNRPFYALDTDEQAIEDSVQESGGIPYLTDKKSAHFRAVAREYLELEKTKRINIRVKTEDLLKLKAKATENKIPYQTLLGSLIHQFAHNQIKLVL